MYKENLSHPNFTEVFLKGEEYVSLHCMSLALNVLSGWGNLTAFVLKLASFSISDSIGEGLSFVINTQEISNQQWQRDMGVWTDVSCPWWAKASGGSQHQQQNLWELVLVLLRALYSESQKCKSPSYWTLFFLKEIISIVFKSTLRSTLLQNSRIFFFVLLNKNKSVWELAFDPTGLESASCLFL